MENYGTVHFEQGIVSDESCFSFSPWR